MENNIIKINQLLDINNFSKEEKDYFWKIITPIFYHPEFQKRLDNKLYPHHGTVSVGTHILHDAIITYKLSLKENGKNKNLNIILKKKNSLINMDLSIQLKPLLILLIGFHNILKI